MLAGGLAVRQNVSGSVKAMIQLMPMKIDQVGAASVMSNGTRYEMADNTQVYLWYKGQYYATRLSEVNSEDYYLTGWYDNFGCAAGKRVRVIAPCAAGRAAAGLSTAVPVLRQGAGQCARLPGLRRGAG